MRVLVAGAYGFIGAYIAARLLRDGHEVVGAGRDIAFASQRYPHLRWIAADFRTDQAEDWARRLRGFEAVVNCVGVLGDGGRDSTEAAHVAGADALFAGCEAAGVRRVIHISAVGASAAARTRYGATKEEGDRRLMARDLDWLILKPSLVIAPGAYGGTALVRGLAGLPWRTPLPDAPGTFRPIHVDDLCEAVARALAPGAPRRVVLDAAGPDEASLAELVAVHRAWLGFGEMRELTLPAWLTRIAAFGADALAGMGARTPLRSTSLKQMAFDVGGDPAHLPAQLGVAPQGFADALAARPATVADRWHARLYFLKPAARTLFALFWIVTGLVCLGPGRNQAIGLAFDAGIPVALAPFAADFGGLFDIVIGALLLMRWRARLVLAIMAGVTLLYIAVLSALLPWLWSDPLGRLLKTVPLFALIGFLAAVEDER